MRRAIERVQTRHIGFQAGPSTIAAKLFDLPGKAQKGFWRRSCHLIERGGGAIVVGGRGHNVGITLFHTISPATSKGSSYDNKQTKTHQA